MFKKKSREGVEEGAPSSSGSTSVCCICTRILRETVNLIPKLESKQTRRGDRLEKREREEKEEN